MKGRLSQLEARMEAIVEGSFARLFAGRVQPRDVALQLARALEDSAAAGAPATRYTVHLHPDDAQALLEAHPDLAERLAGELLTLAREAQLTVPQPPIVTFSLQPSRRPRTFQVAAEAPSQTRHVTQTLTPVRPDHVPRRPRAFVIVDGQRTVMLSEPVVTIGRRLDNQIVVDDPRASRTHAQLRLRFGRYVLYDLGSTAGTFVNGQRVVECVLRPGDVISLGGLPLIYGEEDASASESAPGPSAGSTQAAEAARHADDLPGE
jgi:hypothetical protein